MFLEIENHIIRVEEIVHVYKSIPSKELIGHQAAFLQIMMKNGKEITIYYKIGSSISANVDFKRISDRLTTLRGV